jgi:hypothetical protein
VEYDCKEIRQGSNSNVKLMLMEDGGYSLPTCKGSAPIPTDYRPELDVSPELVDQMASRYQQLIGVLRWMCEIGRIDLLHEVSIMSQHLKDTWRRCT